MTTDQAADRISAPDLTPIAYWTAGTGNPIVLVHGTTSDHTTYNELTPHLARSRTVVSFDRRGRGQSGDGRADYDVEREFADLATLVDTIAARHAGLDPPEPQAPALQQQEGAAGTAPLTLKE